MSPDVRYILTRLLPVISFLCILLLLLAFVIGYRSHQISQNKELLRKKVWWNVYPNPSPIYVDIFATHHVAFFKRFPIDTNWNIILHEPPLPDIPVKELKNRLRLFYNYEIHRAEKRYLDFLVNRLQKKEYVQVLKWYLDNYIYEDFFSRFKNEQYEWARYRAQTYINYAYALPPDAYFDTASPTLSKAREVVEFADSAFPYSPKFVKDKLDYAATANKFRHSADPNQLRYWYQYIVEHPNSLRRDEAELNIINFALQHVSTHRQRQPLLEVLKQFIQEYEDSYLTDDALWYAIQLSIEMGEDAQALSMFANLVDKHKGSDHYKRLKYNLYVWLQNEYRVPADASNDLIDLMFISAKCHDMTVNDVLRLQFPSDEERERVVNVLTFFLRKHTTLSESDSEVDIKTFKVADAILAVLSSWVDDR